MTGSKWSRLAREKRQLTAEDRANRALLERDFQRQVTDLADLLGWSWVHFRAGMNARGAYSVPISGPLGKGWPDLVLLRVRDRRLIFAELKRETGSPTADQVAVLAALEEAVTREVICGDGPHIDRARFGLSPDGYTAWLEAGKPESRHACCPPLIQAFLWRPSDLERIAEVLR